VVAAVLLILVAPVIGVLGVVVRASSAGPALIRLPRVGQGGRPFGIWKLRTMRQAAYAQRAGGSPLTASGDVRITRLGRWLRRYHLDELPQLWNVVRGEMALIGPRPETPEFVDLRDPRWTAVLAARPGILGPTQLVVRGREGSVVAAGGEEGYRTVLLPAKLAIDAWYVQHASPSLDALVVRSVLGLGALERRVGGEVAAAGVLLLP
jgi:lipopolysaccharide/colanic/teichoic acid biosynthesis glycosyltransferase